MKPTINYAAVRKDFKTGLPDEVIAQQHSLPVGAIRRLRKAWAIFLKEKNEDKYGRMLRTAAIKRGYTDEVLALASRETADVVRTHKELIAWMVSRLEWLQTKCEVGEKIADDVKELRHMIGVTAGIIQLEREAYALSVNAIDATARAISHDRELRPLSEVLIRNEGPGGSALH